MSYPDTRKGRCNALVLVTNSWPILTGTVLAKISVAKKVAKLVLAPVLTQYCFTTDSK